eukprot:1157856-Pelagomonas_calceolata.AAC.3
MFNTRAPLARSHMIKSRVPHAHAEHWGFPGLLSQAFSERPDVRHSRAARLACAHIAAVHMDYGLAEGGLTRAHTLQALQHIQELARGS